MKKMCEERREMKLFEDPYEGLNEKDRSIQLMRRLKEIRKCYERATGKCDCIDAFRQSGIFIEKVGNNYECVCHPAEVRELQDRPSVLVVLQQFNVRTNESPKKNLKMDVKEKNKRKKSKAPKELERDMASQPDGGKGGKKKKELMVDTVFAKTHSP